MFDYKQAKKELRIVQKKERECLETSRSLMELLTIPKDWDVDVSKISLRVTLRSYNEKGMMATVEFRAICDQIESVTNVKFNKTTSEMDLAFLEATMKWSGLYIDVTTFDVSGCTITYKEEPVEAQPATVKKIPVFAPECLDAAGITGGDE